MSKSKIMSRLAFDPSKISMVTVLSAYLGEIVGALTGLQIVGDLGKAKGQKIAANNGFDPNGIVVGVSTIIGTLTGAATGGVTGALAAATLKETTQRTRGAILAPLFAAAWIANNYNKVPEIKTTEQKNFQNIVRDSRSVENVERS
jgi:hypothetical protein